MRVLFLMNSSIWSNNLPEGFIEAGHNVKVSGPINEKIIQNLSLEFKPELVISMGWESDNSIEKHLIIKKYFKKVIPHVYWSIEDPAFTKNFSLPQIKSLEPDFTFSICDETVKYLRRLGFKAAYMDFGYSNKVHCNVGVNKTYKCKIALVANFYPDVLEQYPNHYRYESLKILVRPLLKENIRVDFWGKDWKIAGKFTDYNIPNEWMHSYLNYVEANKVYSSADIIIGLQNYTTQVTQRTYEILASEGFLITNDTLGIRKLFNPYDDLVVSSSPEETLKLVRYYLNNPNERKKIAKQGKKAVEGNSYKDRAEYMINVLKEEGIIKEAASK